VRLDDAGLPEEVMAGNRWLRVEQVTDTWRIDDEWWRERPVSRLYYRVLLEDGGQMTVFHDLASGQWRRQEYA
jgi:hypothetical protein